VIVVKYHEAAEDELLTEVGFLAEIRRAEDLIGQFPQWAPEILPGIRKRVLRKFPYSLIYTIERDELLILAVAHHSRRPGYWAGRAY
jgi:plasmid stabilization system protein ParE